MGEVGQRTRLCALRKGIFIDTCLSKLAVEINTLLVRRDMRKIAFLFDIKEVGNKNSVLYYKLDLSRGIIEVVEKMASRKSEN